jgi:hypothetical protein
MINWPDGKPAWAEGYIAGKRLDEEQWLILMPLIGGRARVAVADAGGPGEHY